MRAMEVNGRGPQLARRRLFPNALEDLIRGPALHELKG